MDITEANKKLEKCAKMLMEEFGGEMHFALFVFQNGKDGETIESAFVSSLPPIPMRTVMLSALEDDPDDAVPPRAAFN